MNEQWKQWEGQTVDGKFPLRQFLASTDHSAVFLTQLAETQTRNAVVKLLSADTPAADARLSLWKRAAQLTHNNLLAIYNSGRCAMNGRNLLYVVMEYAEENLGEILPQRALSSDEARDVLNPALDVLVYLHSKGLAHGHLKPSNVLATQDCLKLSPDTFQTLGAPLQLFRSRDIYDAPELPSSPASAKSDVWSLAATLFETLTPRPPERPRDPAADPAIPAELPDLFADIIRHTLRRRPEQRWSIADIAARLNPAPLAAAAVASASPASVAPPISVPLSPEPAVPLAKPTAVAELPDRRPIPVLKRRASTASDYIIPVLLGAAVFLGLIFALPRLFNFHGPSASPQAAIAPEPSAPAKSAEVSKPQEPAPAAMPEKPAATSDTEGSSSKAAETKAETAPAASAAAPIPPAAPVRAKAASDVEGRGEVLDQVLPQVPQKALDTIQGTVRVVVKVEVDPAGNVTDAELDTPGPSHYFAGLAEKAARQWKFTGAEADGHGVPSEWLIRFEFVPSGVQTFPKQIAP